MPIYFQVLTRGVYDKTTGNYEPDTVAETMRYASVYDTKAETMRLVYGAIRQGSLTVHLQMAYKKPFDRIRIGDDLYVVDARRNLRTKQSFVVSEV